MPKSACGYGPLPTFGYQPPTPNPLTLLTTLTQICLFSNSSQPAEGRLPSEVSKALGHRKPAAHDLSPPLLPWCIQCYHGVTMVLPWCYHGVTMVLPWFYLSPAPQRYFLKFAPNITVFTLGDADDSGQITSDLNVNDYC